MKYLALLALVISTAQAQTMESRREKDEMRARAALMRDAAVKGEDAFKKMKLVEGCAEVAKLFAAAPDHLEGILARMDFSRRNVQRTRDEAFDLLRSSHRMDLRCRSEAHQDVDPDQMEDTLKRAGRTLRRHVEVIGRESTSFDNGFRYEYDL
jgi:hypothetical protein